MRKSICRYPGSRRQPIACEGAALLLNERLWMENADTAKGRDEHRRAHEPGGSSVGAISSNCSSTMCIPHSYAYGASAIASRRSVANRGAASRRQISRFACIPWNTSMVRCGKSRNTTSSFARRPCAWKKCIIRTFLPAPSFLSRHTGAWKWRSPLNCAQRQKQR